MRTSSIILASASIGRKMLLEKLGVPFSVYKSSIAEEKIINSDPYKMLQLRSRAKAADVVKKVSSWSAAIGSQTDSISPSDFQNDMLIIAADSMAILDGKTFGKARNKNHAKDMIRALSGRTHNFVTATTIIHLRNNEAIKQFNNTVITKVTCRTMTESEIESYTSRYDFSRFAASYTLNETPWDWITKIEGSYTNVIGLPFEVVLPIFRSLRLLK